MTLNELILDQFRSSGLSRYRLSKLSGVSESSIGRWVGGADIGSDKLGKIANAMGLIIGIKANADGSISWISNR